MGALSRQRQQPQPVVTAADLVGKPVTLRRARVFRAMVTLLERISSNQTIVDRLKQGRNDFM
jgi:hypothetical protein